MKNGFVVAILSLVMMGVTFEVHARKPYHATVAVDGVSATVGATNLVDLTNDLHSTSIEALIPFYTPTSPVGIGINLRGINVITGFAANSTTLTVLIPQGNVATSFDGGTRDNSIKLFKDFLRDQGTHHQLLKLYARYSPIDPIAGNPNSLLSQMGQADYAIGSLYPLNGCGCVQSQPVTHLFQGGVDVGRAFSEGFDTTTFFAPLRYSYSPCDTWALIIDMPLTLNNNGGAYSLFTSIGAGLRYPVTDWWALTPVVRFGAGGSLDLCTAGDFVSAGLNNNMNWKFCGHVLSMINYAGYYASGNLWLTGINFNYHLHNIILKNGLTLTSCDAFTVCNRSVNYNLWFIDSDFERSRLYINHYDEVGVGLIMNGINPCLDYDSLSVGFSYQFGQKSYKAFFVDLAYQF